MNRGVRVEPTPPECALAAEMFDHFCSAGTMKQILALHREICNTLTLRPNRLPDFYPKLKAKLASSWKAQALFKKFDARANHKVYGKGRSCAGGKVLIIGAGPCGLRAAIECQLLGAKVVVIEKRDRMSRNNVLHLWPFVIQDLRALGAKKFFGKFCAGSIDHISIRQLQCILLKVSLLLGVEFHEGVSFEELLEPTTTENGETLGWRARVLPTDHPVAQYEFDALVGADGKRNTLHGFKRKEFRGKLAMAITANFINRHTEQEASVPEISGVAFIFNQKFFKELYEVTGIDLENIVYYKDDTHYFVMTAKKHSLLDKGVLLNDFNEVSRLLSFENVDRAALMRYAQEAARFSTDGRLPLRDFALNHYGEPDVALFDFTSMYAAENASMIYERHGRRLLCQLVGDSLLEPFWPTGSGCARGFLSALDAAWAVRAWGQSPAPHPLAVIAERESIYRLLAQTTPENLHRDFGAYTLDPGTRYPNLNRGKVTPHQVTSFYDSDEPLPLDAMPAARKRRREAEVSEEALVSWVGSAEGGLRGAAGAAALAAVVRRYRPDLLPLHAAPRAVYHVLHHEFGIAPVMSSNTIRDVPDAKIRGYLARVYNAFKGEVPHVHHETDVFDQIKQSQQKEKHNRNTTEHSVSMYSNAADTDKSHSSYRKKRRSVRPQVSSDPAEYIRTQIGRLQIDDVASLARLIEGHDHIAPHEQHTHKQKSIQEQILALLDADDAPDPAVVKETLTSLLGGPCKTRVKRNTTDEGELSQFFHENKEDKPVKPPRRLKGLDASSVKVPDFSDIFDDFNIIDSSNPRSYKRNSNEGIKKELIRTSSTEPKKKDFVRTGSVDSPKRGESIRSYSKDSAKKFERSSSTDIPEMKDRRLSEVLGGQRKTHSPSPELPSPYGRSNSVGASEVVNTKRIAQLFEGHKRRHTPSPESRCVRSGSVTTLEMAMRMKRMAELIDGGRRDVPSPERTRRPDTISTPEMAARRQRVVDLIQGQPRRRSPEPLYSAQRRNSGEMAFRVQRANDMMARKSAEAKRPKSGGGRRKAAREIMRQRFEKSLQMLVTEPRLDVAPSADLKNDYNLQQYRASAPHFGDRVKKLERQLQHYEEGRTVGGGGRGAGSGARVAKLAAELAGTTGSADPNAPRASKPKDLMRSVGKIERDDWNVREIERKIMENRLGRPEPKLAEKVPKWDREQFLGRQRRLKEGEGNEKWGEIDETLHKLDQKLRDSGRPDHGTKKVANLATKFVKKEEPEKKYQAPLKEEVCKKSWRGPMSTGMQCAACGTRVFAAEGVTADGLHLHRACFRCAVCKCVLRPGNYTMERYGSRLVCLRHSGVSVPDAVAAVAALGAVTALGPSPRVLLPPPTPERISLELSDCGAREIDEDEWTDRNFLASETSGAGGLSDEEESSSEEYTDAGDSEGATERSPEPAPEPRAPHAQLYFSDDSFGYDDYSDDGAESSGNESCSRMREAREARRREVPADARPPTDSSEVESEEESSSSEEEEVSSGTEVSTDSEFARDEGPPAAPPAILVTEAPPPPPPAPPAPPSAAPAPEYPLARTRSAGGLATKRALELKRRYLLGESSPPAVRRSDSASHLDTKLEAFRSHITEFQKLLHPAPTPLTAPPAPHALHAPTLAFRITEDNEKTNPMPDIIKNLYGDAPVDLLTKGESLLCKNDWIENSVKEEKEDATRPEQTPEPEPKVELDLDTDSLSEESSHTETVPKQEVPRLEVHDEGGELIQLDSLLLGAQGERLVEGEGEREDAPHSSTSESGRDGTTLALTETELSDWAAESGVLDECVDEGRASAPSPAPRARPPRALARPKPVELGDHVCGRSSPPHAAAPSVPATPVAPAARPMLFSDALEHFQFVDEGEQDPTIESPRTPRNEGYMELVDDDYDPYSPGNDRSINFIERSFSETVTVPATLTPTPTPTPLTPTTSPLTPTASPLSPDLEPITPSPTFPSPQSVMDLAPPDPISPISPSAQEHLKSPQLLKSIEKETSGQSSSDSAQRSDTVIKYINNSINKTEEPVTEKIENLSLSEISPPLERDASELQPEPPSSIQLVAARGAEPVSPPLAPETPRSPPAPTAGVSLRLYAPAICRSASDTFASSRSARASLSGSGSGSGSPPRGAERGPERVQELRRARDEQTEVVRRLVLQRLGGLGAPRRSARRARAPPPVPPPPALHDPPPAPPPPPPPVPPPPQPLRPAPPHVPLPVTPSFSDPELARETRRKSIMKSISNYLNRRLGPRHKWHSEPELSSHESSPAQGARMGQRTQAHKSTGALQEPPAPPVPPPPVSYRPPPAAPAPPEPPAPPAPPSHAHTHRRTTQSNARGGCGGAGAGGAGAGAAQDLDERDAMQLWFEARWARLVAQRRAREDCAEPHARRLARLERRLTRPLSAEQQAATVAELVQVSAQREAHQALMAADRRRSAVGD